MGGLASAKEISRRLLKRGMTTPAHQSPSKQMPSMNKSQKLAFTFRGLEDR